MLAHPNNHKKTSARITDIEFINSHLNTMLAVAADDGTLRIWKDITKEEPKLVTAWQALHEMLPSTRGRKLHFK